MTVPGHEDWFMLELGLRGTYTASAYTTSGTNGKESAYSAVGLEDPLEKELATQSSILA